MSNTANLKKEYQDRIVPALMKEFEYKSVMQVPVLKKIVINQGLGMASADKKIIDIAISELTTITGQKAVATVSKKDISNFKLRKKMPIGVMVTLRREQMYEFLERLVRIAFLVSVTSRVLKASLMEEVIIRWVFRSKLFSLK
jgi:large subunit ribosomal protein L5